MLMQAVVRNATVLTMITITACVLPADELTDGSVRNFAPRLDLDTAEPAAAVSPVDIDDCDVIPVQILARDPDDSTLLLRWVVRDEDDTRFLTDSIETDVPDSVQRLANTIPVSATEFQSQRDAVGGPAGNRTAVVTVYLTDAPEWAISNPNIPNQGQRVPDTPGPYPAGFNLGAIASSEENGGFVFSVVSYSWAFEFNDRGLPCP